MKKTTLYSFIIIAFLSVFLGGCTYKAKTISTSAPAAEIENDKQMECNADYYIDYESDNPDKIVSPSSYICSAHDYPLECKTSINNSIRNVLEGCFENVSQSNDKSFSGLDGKYKFIFDLKGFDPDLSFQAGFWSATINANTEITMRVTVLDQDNEKLFKVSISGDGRANSKGQCGDGAQVLATATEKAVREMLDEFVYDVINSDKLTEK